MNLSKIPSTVLEQVLLERSIARAALEINRLYNVISQMVIKQKRREKELANLRRLNSTPDKQP